MSFVKLDTGILDSTLWVNRSQREIFITALLMALPFQASEPLPQLQVRSIEPTGFVVPIGWYGFIEAAGPGIVRRAGMSAEEGLVVLEALGAPDPESRSSAFEGRRLVRVDGGYLVLNFMTYREKTHDTTAERSKRYRERKKGTPSRDAVTERDASRPTRDESRFRHVADAEAYAIAPSLPLGAQQMQKHPGAPPLPDPSSGRCPETPTPRTLHGPGPHLQKDGGGVSSTLRADDFAAASKSKKKSKEPRSTKSTKWQGVPGPAGYAAAKRCGMVQEWREQRTAPDSAKKLSGGRP